MRITFYSHEPVFFTDFYRIHGKIRKLLQDSGYIHEHTLIYHDGYTVDLWRGNKYSVILRYTMRGDGSVSMLSIETYNEILYDTLKNTIQRMLREKHYDFRVIESD